MTTRVFTVEVTGCKNCPYKKHEFTVSYCDLVMPQDSCFDLYKQNFKAITESCPMYQHSFVKDEKK